jgi:WD40 repeat protein
VGTVTAAAALHDGRALTAAGRQMMMWHPDRPAAGAREVHWPGSEVRSMAALLDGQIVTAERDGRVLVWHLDRPMERREVGHHPGVMAAAVVSAGTEVVTAAADGSLRRWSLVRGAQSTWRGPVGSAPVAGLRAVAELADGRLAVAADGVVLARDLTRAWTGWHEYVDHGRVIRAMAGLPDGRLLIVDEGAQPVLWSAPPQSVRFGESVRAVAALPDGRIVTGVDNRVSVWDPDQLDAEPLLIGQHEGSVKAVVVLPDGRVAAACPARVVVWRPDRPTEALEAGRRGEGGAALTVLSDGRLVVGDDRGALRMWDPNQPGTEPLLIGRHEGAIRTVVTLPDAHVVAAGQDRRILRWNPGRPGAAPLLIGQYPGTVLTAAVLPDGRVVTGGTDGQVTVWNPARAGEPQRLHGYSGWVWAVAVMPGGRVLSAGDGDERLLAADPDRPRPYPLDVGCGCAWVWALATLPDGRIVAAGDMPAMVISDPTRPMPSAL